MWSVPDVNHVSGTDLVFLGGPGRNRTTDTRIFNPPLHRPLLTNNGPSAAQESTPLDVFGNDFGNKTVVLPQGLIKPLTLAEREGFEPSVGLTLRLISSQVHSTTLPPLRIDGSL